MTRHERSAWGWFCFKTSARLPVCDAQKTTQRCMVRNTSITLYLFVSRKLHLNVEEREQGAQGHGRGGCQGLVCGEGVRKKMGEKVLNLRSEPSPHK